MDPEERSLVIACQNGHMNAFGTLYDHYIRRIYDFVYYKTLHKETAEDLTSQVFMKALKQIQQFDAEKGVFAAWLYGIARNAVIDHYRAQRPQTDIDDVWDLAAKDDVERDAHARLQLADVQDYIAKLKPEQREIVMLRVWGGLSYQEIAQTMGKSEASCKMLFSRTMKQLRQALPLAAFLLLISYR